MVFLCCQYIRLNNIKLIPKLGLHGRWGKWRWGMTVTAPSISFWGASKVDREIALQNIENSSDVLYSDQQKRLKTNYKYPLSVASGVAYITPNTLIGLSTELFMGIRSYQMIKAEPRAVIVPEYLNDGLIDFLSIYNFANPVLNGAIGFEQKLSKLFRLHIGFRTDFSYRYSPHQFLNKFVDPKNQSTQKNIFLAPSMDLYHSSLGISMTRRASLVSFGIDYGLGIRNNVEQFTDLSNPQLSSLLQGAPSTNSRITHQIWTLLIGYTYYFALK
ncbi:MAG: hypothetical protein MK212_14680 [Saprospiraceae bacterium]|nr:hypothetical protein [Saprospiraceae bacterium]